MRLAIVSYRLGGPDGVSVVARSWHRALETLGHDVVTVAGGGSVDRVVPGLDLDDRALDRRALADALSDIDVTVVENVCSLPIKPEAGEAVAEQLQGRPAILHHHDLPWQRERFAHVEGVPPTDERWRHVVINELSRRQLDERGIEATTVYSVTDPDPPPGDRDGTRADLGLDADSILMVHPVRAIARKNIQGALGIAAAVGAHYWLLGPTEEGYDDELDRLLTAAACPVHRGLSRPVGDAYAAADVVLLPSTWEGFGLPVIEAAAHRRPVVVGRYPVAAELAGFGLRWLDPDDIDGIRAAARRPDAEVLATNAAVVRRHFSPARLARDLSGLLVSWS